MRTLMCGIAGLARTASRPDDLDTVRRMCRLIGHRGPDDTGTYSDGCMSLGVARLSIIDVAGGHQPMSNESGSIWVALNGEIYNYEELRAELLARGHRFRTRTDTEVLVHLYEDCGIELLDKLNGMFAFALWDKARAVLFLVRDRLGVKPLYYSRLGDGLAFASEMKALLELGELDREVDQDALAEYLTLNYVVAPRTPFASIRKLPSGCYLEYREGEFEERRYWRPPTEPGPAGVPLRDLCEAIRHLITDATRLQLRADVPVGIFASGGIDSSSLMWAASRLGVSLEAFVCEFDDLAADTPAARLAARSTGMRLSERHVSAEEAARLLPKLVWHLDEPLADPAVVSVYLIAKSASERVKVVLNGTGGDELFGGYARYNVRGLLPARWSARTGNVVAALAGGHSLARTLAGALDFRQRYLRRITVFSEADARTALRLNGGETVHQRIGDLFREGAAHDPAASMMFVEIHTYLAEDLFMLLDKMTMAASLEARVPLLDHRLVELAAAIPGELRMRDKNLKWLLRHSLRGHLPDGILDRAKQGFAPPIASWMRGKVGLACARFLTTPHARVVQLFGIDRLRSWIGPAARPLRPYPRRLWTLLILELWWRTFVDDCDLRSVDLLELIDSEVPAWS